MGFFSLGLARLAGDTGQVFALDLQEKMLPGCGGGPGGPTWSGASKPGRWRRGTSWPRTWKEAWIWCWPSGCCTRFRIGLAFLRQVRALLKPGGVFYLAEPKVHVTAKAFEASLATAQPQGLRLRERPEVRLSRGRCWRWIESPFKPLILSNYLLKILSSARGWTHQLPTCFGFRGQLAEEKKQAGPLARRGSRSGRPDALGSVWVSPIRAGCA